MKNYLNRFLFLSLSCFTLISSIALSSPSPTLPSEHWTTDELDPLVRTAIQERGRIKPFETFAREAVLYVTGKVKFAGWNPVELTLAWASDPEIWKNAKIIQIKHLELKRTLGLPESEVYFSMDEIVKNKQFLDQLETVFRKGQRDEALSPLEKEVGKLDGQISTFQMIASGGSWLIVPNPTDPAASWFSIKDIASSIASSGEASAAGLNPEEIKNIATTFQELISAYREKNGESLRDSATRLASNVKSIVKDPSLYPSQRVLNYEVHYNNFRPFRIAWVLYLLALLILIFSFNLPWKWLPTTGVVVTFAAFLCHIYGFLLRYLISGRPPVTNMFETVIWVTWGAVLFSIILYLVYKNRILLTASAGVATVGLILADFIPAVLDPSINPLVPVLRSNFWLTTHVLIINLGYAGGALAAGLGNIVMGRVLFSKPSKKSIETLSHLTYRAMQFGVILLTAGTILGGIWADQSWGRFWGWDPKEVWALISILVYLAVLHGRYIDWLKDFGIAAGGALCFLAIIMAWYGVNFVLGVGLHSYGFGGGGVQYVALFAILQIFFVVAASLKWKKKFN